MQLKNCEKNQEASSDTKLFKQGNAGGPMRSSGHGPIVPNPAWKKSQNPKKAHKVAKPPPIPRQVRDQVNQEPPEYYFENGLRKVRPYHYTYQTYAKQRWLGRRLLDVFEKEFHVYSLTYHKKAIECGQITINNTTVTPDYIVQNSDLVSSSVHRHEPSVIGHPVRIVDATEDLLVVSKPSSIPVHPTGRYAHHTLTRILKYEFGYDELFPINRIDRLTSGLTLIARNKETAAKYSQAFSQNRVKKTYLARVKGHFPYDTIEVNEPIKTVSFKVGVNIVAPDGKPCTTVFKKRLSNGLTSLVECYPKTGRTHQIRVHLQFLGYPIANDPIYVNAAWGEDHGKGLGDDTEKQKHVINQVTGSAFANEDMIDQVSHCMECTMTRKDPVPEQLEIWLHSLRYEGDDGWSFETPEPDWASPDFNKDKDLVERFWKFGGVWDGIAPGTFEDTIS